jgi:hypothetical protein
VGEVVVGEDEGWVAPLSAPPAGSLEHAACTRPRPTKAASVPREPRSRERARDMVNLT